MSILDLAQPATETKESINALVYGPSGVGKTVFAGSGKDQGKKDLLLAVEHGTVSAARQGSKVNVLPINSWDEFAAAVEEVCDDPEKFDWVIIDSLTKLQDLIWSDIIDKAVGANPSRSPYKRELQEYGEAQLRLRAVIERLNNSDANVIYTALAVLATDEESNEFQSPSIHGQKGDLSAWVCAQMDLVVYMSVVRSKDQLIRKFTFNKTPEVFAKDRFGVFTKPVGNLTLEAMTNKLLAEGEETPNQEEK